MFSTITLGVALTAVLLLAIRYIYIRSKLSKAPSHHRRQAKTMIILGSGGHTTEMLKIVNRLSPVLYTPRVYVIADSDTTSQPRIDGGKPENYEIIRTYRSRAVQQSYITSVFTTIWSTLSAIPMLCRVRPDLILCNGPGTCVPICFIAFTLRLLAVFSHETRIVFVESFCRVRTISLSGKILIWLVDLFVVQWPQLQHYDESVRYYGRLL